MNQLAMFVDSIELITVQLPKRVNEEFEASVSGLTKSYERHKTILTEGTTDPFWEDGCNANLVRNHIIYHKRKLEEICNKHGIKLPDCYFQTTPAAVDPKYMAPNSKACRCR